MPTQRESICCQEIEEMKHLVEDPCLEDQPSCITQHADFNHVCLCRTVLTVSFYAHLHRYEDVEVPDDENRYVSMLYSCKIISLCTVRKFRYLAYRH